MNTAPTPHNEARKGELAKTVFMPGDPLRAKLIAETYFENVKCVNRVRNMLAYTGTYKGKPVSVMGAGMGMPSMGIYSYELFHFYGVENIIRIGSAGALQDNLNLNDIVIAMGACTDSNYASQYKVPGTLVPIADYHLLSKAVSSAQILHLPVHVGNILSSDVFYTLDEASNDAWRKMGILATDMEAAALYLNAMEAGKNAVCLLTISDHLYKKEYLSSQERQEGFGKMISLALELL